MKVNDFNGENSRCVTEWNKPLDHEEVLEKIKNAGSFWNNCQCDYGHCTFWDVRLLPTEFLMEVLKRDREDEILPLIHRFGQSAPPENVVQNGCAKPCRQVELDKHVLPEEFQQEIARRCKPKEMDAYLSYNGFGALGQDVVLDRGNHEEIMWYLGRHGFLPAQQRRLLSRNNTDEIRLHICRHGLSDELLNEMFMEIENGGDLGKFYWYIEQRELPVWAQIAMLKCKRIDEAAFKVYIGRYGLWNEAHRALVEERSEEEIRSYLQKHPYLCGDGEQALAAKGLPRLALYYASRRVNYNDPLFVEALLVQDEIDEAAVSAVFLKMDFSTPDDDVDVMMMRFGWHTAIMERIKLYPLSLKALSFLFFKGDKEAIKVYAQTWLKARQA